MSAKSSSSHSTNELVDCIVTALVDHYGDPVHAVELAANSIIDNPPGDEGTGAPTPDLPPVLAFQLDQLLRYCSKEPGDDAAGNRKAVFDVWFHLIGSYSTRVRPAALARLDRPGDGMRDRAPGAAAAAAFYYELLVSHFLARQSTVLLAEPPPPPPPPPPPTAAQLDGGTTTDGPGSQHPKEDSVVTRAQVLAHGAALERLACDITLATAMNVGEASGNDPADDADGGGSKGSDDKSGDTDRRNRVAMVQVLLAALVRQVNNVWRVIEHWDRGKIAEAPSSHARGRLDDNIGLRCAVSMLALGWNPEPLLELPKSVSNDDVDRESDASSHKVSPSSSLHRLPFLLASRDITKLVPPLRVSSMDWSMLLQLKGSFYATTRSNDGVPTGAVGDVRLQNAARIFWYGLSFQRGAHRSMDFVESEREINDSRLRDAMFSRWSAERQAKAIRAHFFGRDMVPAPAASEKDRGVVSRAKPTRLFLGKVVPYKPDPELTQKAHVQIPSRVAVSLRWFSLLQSQDLTHALLEEVLPVLYELLSASSYALNGWGAVAAHRLVTLGDGNDEDSTEMALWNETIVTNLLNMLHTVAKTCREGPVLAVASKAYCRLLRQLGTHHAQDASRQRRLASHHWLTVLYQNQTRAASHPALMLGLLVGVAQILHDQVACAGISAADGLEVGRLGLSALLPLLAEPDEGNWFEAASLTPSKDRRRMKEEMRLVTLVALNNLLVAAYPIVPRHSGKVLSHLLLVCADLRSDLLYTAAGALPSSSTHPLSQPQRLWIVARHVAATSLILCGGKGEAFLLGLENGEESYSADFWSVVRTVRESANELLLSNEPFQLAEVVKPG